MVATGGNRSQMERPLKRPRQAKTVPVGCAGCLSRSMVRRGSTVRVRQRALQKLRNRGFFCRRNMHELQRGVGMEPFMERSGRERVDRTPPIRSNRALGRILSQKEELGSRPIAAIATFASLSVTDGRRDGHARWPVCSWAC